MRNRRALFLGLFLASVRLFAAAPGEINYQGKLTDPSGNPTPGPVSVTARIFDSSSGGTQLYTGTKGGVAVANGVFNLVIGAAPMPAIPNTVFTSTANAWLEIQVNATVLVPRQKLAAAPYALAVANGAINFANWSSNGCADQQIPKFNFSLGQWGCANDTGGTVTGSGAAGRVSFWSGASVLASSASLAWDNANGRLGVGTASPNEQVEITGNLRLPPTSATGGRIMSGVQNLMHTFGTNNFFAGINAGNLVNTASENVGVGYSVLANLQAGYQNSALGYAALTSLDTGGENTAVGNKALMNTTSGSGNTALGYAAGRGPGGLTTNITGSGNTFLGAYSRPETTTQLNNATAIGSNSQVGCDYCMVLGGTGVDAVKVGIGKTNPAQTLDVMAPGDSIAIAAKTNNGVAINAWAGTLGQPNPGVFGISGNGLNASGVQGLLFGDAGPDGAAVVASLSANGGAKGILVSWGGGWVPSSARGVVVRLPNADATNRFFQAETVISGATDVKFYVDSAGNVRGDGSYSSPATDAAEWMPTAYAGELEPGDLLMADGASPASLVKKHAGRRYSAGVLGVVSTKPGFVTGAEEDEARQKKTAVVMAMVGRVPVKVCGENGPVKPGDWLTSSSRPGVAMKATEPGPVVGVALESFNGSAAQVKKILCWVSLGEGLAAPAIGELKTRLQNVEERLRQLEKK